MALKFPVGCRFDPTDEEIISHYLLGKILATLSPIEHILVSECDLYGNEEPKEIWERLGGGGGQHKEGILVFTKLKRAKKVTGAKKASGLKIERKVRGDDGGTWHGEDAGSEILAEKMIDGRKRQFIGKKKRFNYKQEGTDQHCLWIMHEYSLENVDSDWVVCRLKKNERLARKRKVVAAGMEDPAEKAEPCPDSPPSMKSRPELVTVCPESLEKHLTQHVDDDVHCPPNEEECSVASTKDLRLLLLANLASEEKDIQLSL